MGRVAGTAFFLMSLVLAATALTVSRQKPQVDYGSLANCISEQRFRQSLEDLHQELVNALYACGVYEAPLS